MANETNEPRALTAALSGPAFATKGGGLAMHVANRHVERWAPEATASQVRPLRNLGFVDRLVAPWIETAQRSASMRLFSQYIANGAGERSAGKVSWVFPRPWYQDELDWMASAREVGAQTAMAEASAPSMLTTRGTYLAPAQARAAQLALPTSLYEYVAPSLSVARPDEPQQHYSPLISVGAAQAAHGIARAMAPLGAGAAARMSPGLRSVLATMLERTGGEPASAGPTRASLAAPELVTPPAPRAAEEVAEQYAEQHARVAELQRMARVTAERELATREAQQRPTAQPARTERLIEQRAGEAATRREATDAIERQRIEERIAQRLAERGVRAPAQDDRAQRLHDAARDAAARDARDAPVASVARAQPVIAQPSVAPELAAAVAALPPELASILASSMGRRPERAAQAIGEIGEALRTVELLARNAAAGGTFESARGPRLMMPAGLGGLVASVDRAPSVAAPASRAPLSGASPASTTALGATVAASPAALHHVAWADRWLARFAGARPRSLDVLSASASTPATRLQMLSAAAPGGVFVAPAFDERDDSAVVRGEAAAPVPGMPGVTRGAAGAPITGERMPSRRIDTPPSEPILRFDDDAATPDDVFTAISAAATRTRVAAVAPAPATPEPTPELAAGRDTLADAVAYAVPSAPGAGLSAQLASSPFAPALRHVMSVGASPSFDVRALFGDALGATFLAGLIAPANRELAIDVEAREVPAWQATYVAGGDERVESGAEALTTLRSALLAWDGEVAGSPPAADARESGPSAVARSMTETMALPMLGERGAIGEPVELAGATTRLPAYGAPGMLADRAQAWSVAQERSAADLSLDFVPPELLLAARVYGLGPAEAAQAMRLAIAGPGQLSAMASTVDRTFVQALAIEAERRERVARPVTAFPRSASDLAPGASSFAPSGTAFGVERRAPRGAFLWPSATIAALGLNAAAPDGEQSMSVAALELLAAQSVAELGTYAALDEGGAPRPRIAGQPAAPTDAEVLGTASALVPAARRSKFEALFVALGQSATAKSWSPAARAARALALAGRGEDSITARERASIAWDVLPIVAAGGLDEEHATGTLSTGAAAQRAAGLVESRPGLGALSARAGEALGSYVAPPAPAPAAGTTSAREQGAALRAPTAAQELVRTGRPSGRHGGGEVEIPPWFEAAARKMLEERSGASDGISLAELTLVTAAPATHVAASTRGVPSAAPAAPASSLSQTAPQQLDVEAIAYEVYKQILVLMDATRARNGEPYL